MSITTQTTDNPAGALPSQPTMSLRRYAVLVCWGMVVTNLGQFSSLGDLPLKFLLKDVLLVSPTAMAFWFTIAILPWSFKPLAALLVDGVPLRGVRNRYYLLLGALLGGCCWLALGFVPKNYHVLLVIGVCLNVMMMLTSTVVGGLLVEGGQTYGATGRLSSIRMIVANVVLLFVGPLGGFLAAQWFGWTAIIGGILFFSMIPATLLLLREKPIAREQRAANPITGMRPSAQGRPGLQEHLDLQRIAFSGPPRAGIRNPVVLLQERSLEIRRAIHWKPDRGWWCDGFGRGALVSHSLPQIPTALLALSLDFQHGLVLALLSGLCFQIIRHRHRRSRHPRIHPGPASAIRPCGAGNAQRVGSPRIRRHARPWEI